MSRVSPVNQGFVMRHAFLAFFSAAVCLFGAGAQAAPARASAGDQGVAALVTRVRAANGLGPVRMDPALTRAAQRQADAMAAAGVLSHEIGGAFGARMNAAGLGHVPTAENVGVGHRSAEAAIASWQRSPGHAANLLMNGVTRIGMARSGAYWAMVLAAEDGPGRMASGGFMLLPFGISFGR